jgi:hypothetical protein
MRNTRIFGAASVVLLIIVVIVFVSAMRSPVENTVGVTLAKYNIEGKFDRLAYGVRTRSQAQPVNLVFFPKIIDTLNGSFSYSFTPDKPVSDLSQDIRISAVLTSPGLWEKEMPLTGGVFHTPESKLDFPIDFNSLITTFDNISTDLGIKSESAMVILKASVLTTAQTDSGPIQESFSQTTPLTLNTDTIEWESPLNVEHKGYQKGVAYEQKGLFGYAVKLKPNLVFGAVTLNSSPPAEVKQRRLPESPRYEPAALKKLDISYNYRLSADKTIDPVENEIRASTVLTNEDGASIDFPLIPQQKYKGDFSLDLPLDAEMLFDLIENLENVPINNVETIYTLTVSVNVHSVSAVAGKPIDEYLTSELPLTLTSDGLSWPDQNADTRENTVSGTEQKPNKDRSTLIMVGFGLLMAGLALALLALWFFMESRRTRSALWEKWSADQNIREKRREIMSNVRVPLQVHESDKVITMESLAELVKVADSVFKPVLHYAGSDGEMYWVMDAGSLYWYMGPLKQEKYI